MSKIKITKTQRGFAIGEFTDRNGQSCSIQESSLAFENCIWLGIDDVDAKIMSSDAVKLGLRQKTFDENDNGWVKFEMPEQVVVSTRMHLTRKQVKSLLPLLQQFVETGTLPRGKKKNG